MTPGEQHLQTDEDVDNILRLAVRNSHPEMGDLRARLHASAAELGISPEELAAAEASYLAQRQEQASYEEFRQDRLHQRHRALWDRVPAAVICMGIDLTLSMIGGQLRLTWSLIVVGILVAVTLAHWLPLLPMPGPESTEFRQWHEKKNRRRRRRTKATPAPPAEE